MPVKDGPSETFTAHPRLAEVRQAVRKEHNYGPRRAAGGGLDRPFPPRFQMMSGSHQRTGTKLGTKLGIFRRFWGKIGLILRSIINPQLLPGQGATKTGLGFPLSYGRKTLTDATHSTAPLDASKPVEPSRRGLREQKSGEPGELTQRTWNLYRDVMLAMGKGLGGRRLVVDLDHKDFARLRTQQNTWPCRKPDPRSPTPGR